eukprot:scaffold24571_cov57-Phaeocystis_antarctica.AAC.4
MTQSSSHTPVSELWSAGRVGWMFWSSGKTGCLMSNRGAFAASFVGGIIAPGGSLRSGLSSRVRGATLKTGRIRPRRPGCRAAARSSGHSQPVGARWWHRSLDKQVPVERDEGGFLFPRAR